MWTSILTSTTHEIEYHSMTKSEANLSQLEEAPSKVAFLQLKITGNFSRFCKINGSARIHISVDFEGRIFLNPSYLTSIQQLPCLSLYPAVSYISNLNSKIKLRSNLKVKPDHHLNHLKNEAIKQRKMMTKCYFSTSAYLQSYNSIYSSDTCCILYNRHRLRRL